MAAALQMAQPCLKMSFTASLVTNSSRARTLWRITTGEMVHLESWIYKDICEFELLVSAHLLAVVQCVTS